MESIELTKEQKEFPIWLVGDSYPSRLVNVLKVPLDPKHPTRHTIWTPIWDAIQESVYPKRVDGKHLFICNAAKKGELDEKPNKDFKDVAVKDRIALFSSYLTKNRPPMVLCFGAWAYEFVRRANGCTPTKNPTIHWGVTELGRAFRKSCEQFHPKEITIFPLLHQTVALQWQHANKNFAPNSTDNYFRYTGNALGELLNKNKSAERLKVIWLPAQQA